MQPPTARCLLVFAALLPLSPSWGAAQALPRETVPEPIPVSGRVVDEAGHPRVDLSVLLERTRRWDEPFDAVPTAVEGTTDGGGVFRARLPTPGFWRVLLVPDDGAPVSTTLPHQPISRETDLGDLVQGEPPAPGEGRSRGPLRVASPEEPRTVDEDRILEARVVREEDGRAMPHALVGSSPRLWTLADGEGRFRLPVRGTAGQDLRVEIEARGRERTWVPLAQVEPGGDVPLPPATVYAGRVVNEADEPVADAQVGFYLTSGQRRPAVRTGPDGAFRIEAPRRHGPLQALHPAYLAQVDFQQSLEERPLDLLLVLERGFPAAGRVVDETGRGVPGAELRLFRLEAGGGVNVGQQPIEARTDDDGRYRVERLREGTYAADVLAAGHVPHHQRSLELRAPPPVRQGDDEPAPGDLGTLEIETAVRLHGMVLDPDFQPVAGARIGWRQRGLPRLLSDRGARPREELATREWQGWRFRDEATSDDEGRFAVDGLARDLPVALEASRDGYLPAETAAHPGPGAETGTRQEPFLVVLQPAGLVEGRVEDAAGSPIEEAEVSARPLAGITTHPLRAFTDADGRFRLTQVPEGTVEVVASQPGRPAARETVEIAAGAPSPPLVLVLEQGVPFTGRVVDAQGEPLPGTHITLIGAELTAGAALLDDSTPRTTAGDGGRFEIEGIAPGNYRAWLRHDDYRPLEVQVSIGPSGGDRELQLTDGGLHVAGRVIAPDGTPARRASLFAQPRDSSGSGPSSGFRGAPTEDDGTFVLRGLEPEVMEVYIAGVDGLSGPRTVDLTGGSVDELVIDLGGPGRVVGRIVGLAEGERRPVRVRIEGPRRISAEVGADGSFEFDRLAPGEWTVYGSRVGGATASRAVTIPEGGGEVRVELDLGVPGRSLEGVVLLDGEPRGGLRVFATRGMLDGGSTQTDFSGGFQIDGLEAGTYDLGVHDPGTGLFHLREIRLDGDREIWVEIEVVTVEGTVVDPSSGRPLAGVPVRFVPLDVPPPFDRVDTFVPASRADSAGTFRVGPLAAGRYRVVVGADPAGEVDLTSGLDVAGVVLSPATGGSR